MVGSPSTSSTYNSIDVPPLASTESDVNGTANMRVFTDDSPSSNLVFTFDTAITAFGADFRSFNDVIARTDILVGADTISPPIGATGNLFSFFGFTSDTAFNTITFSGLANDVYGIDNVTYGDTDVTAPVPAPATLALFGLCILSGNIKFIDASLPKIDCYTTGR